MNAIVLSFQVIVEKERTDSGSSHSFGQSIYLLLGWVKTKLFSSLSHFLGVFFSSKTEKQAKSEIADYYCPYRALL